MPASLKKHIHPPLPKKQKPKEPLTTQQKLAIVFRAINSDADWTFSEFIFHAFQDKESRTQSHGNTIQRFLSGQSKHSVGEILECWWRHKDGRHDRDSPLMYSTSTSFTKIKAVRPSLSSFAVQIMKDKLVREAKEAVKASNGLHATTNEKSTRKANWVDIGATTIPSVAAILKSLQPITWYLISQIAEHKPRSRSGVIAIRKNRPIEAVSDQEAC